MSPIARLNVMLAAAVILLAGAIGAMFSYQYWWPKLAILINKPVRDLTAGEYPAPECLKVSDFYSVHLTTYFLADSQKTAGGPNITNYAEYCDRVPGTGKVIFSVVLMETDAREESVVLSFWRYEPGGALSQIDALPPHSYPRGILTLGATVAHSGKYLLKVAFGAAKNKDDIIEMPIYVGS